MEKKNWLAKLVESKSKSSDDMDNNEVLENEIARIQHYCESNIINPYERFLLELNKVYNLWEIKYNNHTIEYTSDLGSSYVAQRYIESDYRKVTNQLATRNQHHALFVMEPIYNFAKFLFLAEKLLVYSNDKSDSVYATADKDSELKLYVKTDSFNIGYCFAKDIDIKNSKSLLDNYLDGDTKPKLLLIMQIKRNLGSESTTTFNFEFDGAMINELPMSSEVDSFIFNTAINTTYDIILSTYNEILNNSFNIYTGINEDDLSWQERIKLWG